MSEPLPGAKAPDQRHCHACGQLVHVSAAHCLHCGAVLTALPVAVASVPTPAPAPAAAVHKPLGPGQVYCRGCGAGIHHSAPHCPHCGATQAVVPPAGVSSAQGAGGAPWLAIVSLVLGIACLLALLDDSGWDRETLIGYFGLALPGLVTGVAAVHTNAPGRGMAIAGIVLSAIALLAGFGLLVE